MEFSWTRDWTCVPCIGRQILIHWAIREVPDSLLYNKKIYLNFVPDFWQGASETLGISSVTGNDLTHGRVSREFHAGVWSSEWPIWWLEGSGWETRYQSFLLASWDEREAGGWVQSHSQWFNPAYLCNNPPPPQTLDTEARRSFLDGTYNDALGRWGILTHREKAWKLCGPSQTFLQMSCHLALLPDIYPI